MKAVDKHSLPAGSSFDGKDLDCGNGLLLLIRKHLDLLERGQLLEILSRESSVEEDLPAWCRLTKNELVSWTKAGNQRSFLVCKGPFDPNLQPNGGAQVRSPVASVASDPVVNAASIQSWEAASTPASTPVTAPVTTPPGTAAASLTVPDIHPLSVMGMGSWPRPSWLLRALHEWLEGKTSDDDFNLIANDAVQLAVASQLRAEVDVVTDGEQRRDNYAGFVGKLLDNCQLIPLIDLLPLVDDPEQFAKELQSLDVPAEKVRHAAVFGRLARTRTLALHEFQFVKTLTDKPIKIALPGPYLLTRTMWLECISDKAYSSREELADDIVRILREEIHALLEAGTSLVQLDEPVLTEVVFAGAKNTRSFMCGALSERGAAAEELAFASRLINAVTQGFPRGRLAMHICRGNWTPDESVALQGDYRPLLPLLQELAVGTMFLEFCTPRAGDLDVIRELPAHVRIGVGVVNPKNPRCETLEEVVSKAEAAIGLVGFERVLLVTDCGFATFADNPVCSGTTAEAKLRTMAQAAAILRSKYGHGKLFSPI